MKPTHIHLIRHGQSEGNVSRAIYTEKPDYAVNLTVVGKAQAVQAGKQLAEITGGDAYFYVSPFYRTRQTLDEILKSFPNVDKTLIREDARLREQEWTGQMMNGYKQQEQEERDDYGSYFYRFSGAESCADVEDRISCFLNTLHRDFEKPHFPKHCVLVMHGMSMRVFLKRWLHLGIDEFEMLKNPKNCERITLVKGEDNRYSLTAPLEKHANLLRKF